jgi:hypothetical protein
VHKLFARQLAKATTPSGKVDLDELGGLVGSAYDQADHDRRRTDRSISLMIEELDTLNRGLEKLVAVRTEALRDSEAQITAQNLRFEAAVNNVCAGALDRADAASSATSLPADVRPLPRGVARLRAAICSTTQSTEPSRRHRPIT